MAEKRVVETEKIIEMLYSQGKNNCKDEWSRGWYACINWAIRAFKGLPFEDVVDKEEYVELKKAYDNLLDLYSELGKSTEQLKQGNKAASSLIEDLTQENTDLRTQLKEAREAANHNSKLVADERFKHEIYRLRGENAGMMAVIKQILECDLNKTSILSSSLRRCNND